MIFDLSLQGEAELYPIRWNNVNDRRF